MQIKVDMPFEECETCPKCSLRVEEQVSFVDDRISREVIVGCRNDKICDQTRNKVGEENDVR